jgi:glycosyltransferase involved in cell wall biosynthesis
MKVSVVIPLYNGAIYIRRAIETLLAQTYKDFEIVVIDDGSSDASRDIVMAFSELDKRVRYFYQKNEGIVGALNHGLSRASGEYIAFCDQDDWWLPEKLKIEVGFLDKNSGIDLVYADCFMFENGSIKKNTFARSRNLNFCRSSDGDCCMQMFWKNFIPAPLTILMRRTVFEKIGNFDKHFSFAYDYHYWLLALRRGMSVDYINEPLAVWRDRPEDPSKVRESKIMTLRILINFLSQNSEFVLENPIFVFKKMIKVLGGLILGKTLLRDATRK